MDYNKKVADLTVGELIDIIEQSVATVLSEMIEAAAENFEEDDFLTDTGDNKKLFS